MSSPYSPAAGLNAFKKRIPPEVQPVGELFGTGSPEGNVEAPPGTLYTDTLLNLRYVKVCGVSSQGWQASGDAAPATSGGTAGGSGAVVFEEGTGESAGSIKYDENGGVYVKIGPGDTAADWKTLIEPEA